MIKILAKSELKPGSWEKVGPLYQELIENTRKEEGCIEYGLFIDVKDENKCCFVEAWESEEALTAHMNSAHFKRLLPQIREFSAGSGEMTKLREFTIN